jgi:hypothetical protein
MFRTAVETSSAGGHEVRTSDLDAMPSAEGFSARMAVVA